LFFIPSAFCKIISKSQEFSGASFIFTTHFFSLENQQIYKHLLKETFAHIFHQILAVKLATSIFSNSIRAFAISESLITDTPLALMAQL
jgi:hypothetical protein